jgi:hypothetical protein
MKVMTGGAAVGAAQAVDGVEGVGRAARRRAADEVGGQLAQRIGRQAMRRRVE